MGQAELKIEADGPVVEAMIRFLYTGELHEGEAVDCAEVLLLAHRYQVQDFVALAKARVLQMVSRETVVKTVRVLRLLREADEHSADWENFCEQASQNVELFKA